MCHRRIILCLRRSFKRFKVFSPSFDLILLVFQGKKHFIYPACDDVMSKTKQRVTWCSLVPLNGPAIVTTSGLRWNLDSGTLNFEGLISTSNEFDGSHCAIIETDKSVLWSMKDTILTSTNDEVTTTTEAEAAAAATTTTALVDQL